MELFVDARRERLFDRLDHKQKQQNRRKVIQIRRYLHDNFRVICYPYQDSQDAYLIEEVHLERGHVLVNDDIIVDELNILAIQLPVWNGKEGQYVR